MQRLKQFRLAALVALALCFAGVHSASAQVSSFTPSGTSAVGIIYGVYNVTDSVIVNGSLVMIDTTTAASSAITRIGVRNYLGVVLDRSRILGIAVGNISKSSRGGNGKVLVYGYHPNAFLGASNIAAKRPLKVGLINGAFSDADTLTATCGYLISMSSATTSTGVRYRGKVFFWGTHGWGAQL